MNNENNLTLSSSKLNKNLDILGKLNSFLFNLRQSKEDIKTDEYLDIIFQVINPIIDRINGKLSFNTIFDEENVIKFLKRNYQNSDILKEELIKIREKFKSNIINFDDKFFEIMNTIANAIQIESGLNFKKMRIFP